MLLRARWPVPLCDHACRLRQGKLAYRVTAIFADADHRVRADPGRRGSNRVVTDRRSDLDSLVFFVFRRHLSCRVQPAGELGRIPMLESFFSWRFATARLVLPFVIGGLPICRWIYRSDP